MDGAAPAYRDVFTAVLNSTPATSGRHSTVTENYEFRGNTGSDERQRCVDRHMPQIRVTPISQDLHALLNGRV